MKIFGITIPDEDDAMEGVGIRVYRGDLRGAAKRMKRFTTIGYERRIIENDDGTTEERVFYTADYYKAAVDDKTWVRNKLINAGLWLAATFALFFTSLTPSLLNSIAWPGLVDLVAMAILAYYTYMLIINLASKRNIKIYYYLRGVLRLKKSSVYLAGCVVFGLISGLIYAIIKKCFNPMDIRCLVGQAVSAVLFSLMSYVVVRQEYAVEHNDDPLIENSKVPEPEKTKDELELERLKQLPDAEPQTRKKLLLLKKRDKADKE